MKQVAFDTSVLIAAVYAEHPHHERALPWVEAVIAKRIGGVVSGHAIAETYSVLTKLPVHPRLDPATARAIVHRLIDGPFVVAPLDESLYRAAVDRCVATDSISGAIYDAVHVLTAETNRADALVTFNERHFRQLHPAVPLVVPPDPPGLSDFA